jgi:hypothetical protein
MFGRHPADLSFYPGREQTSTSMIPVIAHIPRWKENGRIEQGLFDSTDELSQRVTDEFLVEMAREAKQEREKIEAKLKKQEEERKKRFLKEKWQKILGSMAKNYKSVELESEVLDPRVSTEVKRCMTIPSEYLRTKLVSECEQCSKEIWKDQKHYESVRHPHDERLDFDGHFPEDHVCLEGFEEYTQEEKQEHRKKRISFEDAW